MSTLSVVSSTAKQLGRQDALTARFKAQNMAPPMGLFSKLPGELCNKIFNYVLTARMQMPHKITISVLFKHDQPNDVTAIEVTPRPQAGFINSCRQIKRETSALFPGDPGFEGYLRNYIRHLTATTISSSERELHSAKLRIVFQKDPPAPEQRVSSLSDLSSWADAGAEKQFWETVCCHVISQRSCFEKGLGSMLEWSMKVRGDALHMWVVSVQGEEEQFRVYQARRRAEVLERTAAGRKAFAERLYRASPAGANLGFAKTP